MLKSYSHAENKKMVNFIIELTRYILLEVQQIWAGGVSKLVKNLLDIHEALGSIRSVT